MRRLFLGFIVGAALVAAGCNDHSLSLDLTPNPLVLGLTQTQATVHAHAVAKGFGRVPISSVQFAVFNSGDSELASQTESVDRNIPATPFGFVIDKDFSFPINGALVALSGTKYIMVKVLDPQGSVIAQRRLDVVVHALQGLALPPVLHPQPAPSH